MKNIHALELPLIVGHGRSRKNPKTAALTDGRLFIPKGFEFSLRRKNL